MIKHSDLVLAATNLGIDKVGVSPADALDGDRLNEWLKRGCHGEMAYMERNLDKRLSPKELVPSANSVISIFVNYHQSESQAHLDGVISKYARGADYHFILKDQLHKLAEALFADELVGKIK